MAKQTFTTGQVLTAAQMTSLQQTAMGGGSATAKTASYTLVAADAGTTVIMNSASATTITVNTSLFAAGDTVYISNIGAGVSTITAGSATVSTSATLALAQYEGGTLYFTATSAALFFKASGAAGGGGKVLQVVTTNLDDTFSSASTSYVDITGLSRAITPSSATSKILVMVQLSATPAFGVNRAFFRLVRDSTAIDVGVANGSRFRASIGASPGNDTLIATSPIIFLDSPATTSSTTYKVQGVVGVGSGSFYVNRSYTWNDDGNATYASTITCLEIGA